MGMAVSLWVLKALSFLLFAALPAAVFADSPPSVGLPPTIPLAPQSSQGVSTQFTSAGLTSMKWNGTEMLASGAPSIQWVGLIQPDGSWTTGDSNPVSTADVATQTLTQKFAWGTIKYAYSTTATQMFANVTIQNTSSTPVGMFIIQLAEVKFPSTPTEYDGSDPMVAWNMGNPSIIHTSFGTGSLALTNEDVVNPLMIGWPWAYDAAKTTFPLLVMTGKDASYPSSYPFIDRQIPAGGTLTFEIGFRFGPVGATNYQLAGDIYQKFATAFPQTLKWTDHRPIAQLFLTNFNGTYPTNPRRWFGDGSVDITTPAGLAAFQARVLAYADSSVAICKAENAQAAITWDMEGQQFPQATSYIGDPRLVDVMAPEISPVIDAYFKKFTDAGIKIGMTIRPQQLYLTASNTQAYQEEVADPGALMIAKIGYAYNRWGARVFYVDSNGAADDPTDVKFFQAVAAAFPDILVIPEHSNMEYYSITAPYGQLNMGVTSTPPEVLWAYPQAFSVFTISDADVTDNMATLVNSVMRGDVLFFRGWFAANENPQVTQIYGSMHLTNSPASPP
jgi:hypothetical protein